MKKVIPVMICACLLTGCRSKRYDVVSSVEETEEPVKETVWAVEPGLELDDVKPLEGFRERQTIYSTKNGGDQILFYETEQVGYPQEWGNTGYMTDAVIAEKDGMMGIWDYSGNELYPISIRINTTPFNAGITSAYWLHNDTGSSEFVFGAADTSKSKAYIFSKDFTSVTEVSAGEFISDPFGSIPNAAQLCMQNDSYGVLYRTENSDGEIGYQQSFDFFEGEELDDRAVVPVIDGSFSKTGSYTVMNKDGSYAASIVNGRGTYQEKTFVNGFYLSGTAQEKAFFNADQASQISYDYHDALYFEDGYAPVKLYGKWGFINEQGKEVTDFIFDDVSPVYQGRAYVKKGDTWGILNLKSVLEEGKQINLATCYSTENEYESIGKVTVNVRNLTFRSKPATGGTSCGSAMEGSVYPVYEKTEADGYTWYRVDAENWIADDGEWLTFTEG